MKDFKFKLKIINDIYYELQKCLSWKKKNKTWILRYGAFVYFYILVLTILYNQRSCIMQYCNTAYMYLYSSTTTVYSVRDSTSCVPITPLSIKRRSFAISCPRWTAQTRPSTSTGNDDVTMRMLCFFFFHIYVYMMHVARNMYSCDLADQHHNNIAYGFGSYC